MQGAQVGSPVRKLISHASGTDKSKYMKVKGLGKKLLNTFCVQGTMLEAKWKRSLMVQDL